MLKLLIPFAITLTLLTPNAAKAEPTLFGAKMSVICGPETNIFATIADELHQVHRFVSPTADPNFRMVLAINPESGSWTAVLHNEGSKIACVVATGENPSLLP